MLSVGVSHCSRSRYRPGSGMALVPVPLSVDHLVFLKKGRDMNMFLIKHVRP